MSCNTARMVSGIIINLRSTSHEHYVTQWLGAFITAWPIIFIAILLIAPAVNKPLNFVVKTAEI